MANSPNLQALLGLEHPSIAIGFLDEAPKGLSPYNGKAQPASCAFWKVAWEGAGFYTQPGDHYGCAVGAHTHHVPLPPERASELESTVNFMVEKRYLRPEEVPHIPAMPRAPKFVAYAPEHEANFTPDVVIVSARPAKAMLLYEAALRSGAGEMVSSLLGRPGCAVIPLAAGTGKAAFSFGCRGNRTFTGLADDEMYLSVPGARWSAVRAALTEIMGADRAMAEYYEHKRDSAG